MADNLPVTLNGVKATAQVVTVIPLTGSAGSSAATPTYVQAAPKQETLTLITNNTVAQPQPAYGGDYVWSVTGTFGGTSVQLQALGPDGATYQNIGAAKTAPDTTGGTGVGLGSNAVVRATVTGGTPTGLYATLARIP